MDTLFESSYERNEELAKEVNQYYFRTYVGFIVLYVMLAIVAGVNLFLCWLEGLNAQRIVFWLAIAVCVIMQYSNYRRSVKALLARDRELYGEVPVRVFMKVTEDRVISSSSTGTEGETRFKDIRYATETKSCVMLCTRAGQFLVMRKDAFTKGDWEELLAFIEKEGIKVKR